MYLMLVSSKHMLYACQQQAYGVCSSAAYVRSALWYLSYCVPSVVTSSARLVEDEFMTRQVARSKAATLQQRASYDAVLTCMRACV